MRGIGLGLGVGWLALGGLGAGLDPGAAPPPSTPPVESGIQPIFARRCLECHGPEKQKSGLRLDRRADALRAGDSGRPAIVPGRSAASELMLRVTSSDPDRRMPPKGAALTADAIESLRAWIDAGAEWPAVAAGAQSNHNTHWAFSPPRPELVPNLGDDPWVRNPIDAFVLERLRRERIRPSAEADRITLIRRLSFDLLGVPPDADAARAFAADPRPDAYERLVERMLDSPHFGEHWGRHWLDLARFADSDGYEKDTVRPYAHHYRDWLIRALNQDMPFDRFTIEQLAGDLLPVASVEQFAATGFHRQTLTNKEGGVDQEEFRCKATVDRVNTTGTVWLGLTVGCAECHSHKYDPLSQREFFQLYAFFNDASETNITLSAGLPANEADEKKSKSPSPYIAALARQQPARETRIHLRGDFLNRGERVHPGTPEILHPLHARAEKADRLDLAHWLVNPANPLTARVAVNRVWGHLFGKPLVDTPEDFGTRGAPPSHPELLDWLAQAFQTPADSPCSGDAGATPERGLDWSLKGLIRLIVGSSAYRQSSHVRIDLAERDPRNVLLARQNRFRIPAENVRDAALAASGLLCSTLGGPSVRPPLPADIAALSYAGSLKWAESTGPDRYRRGLYIQFQRTVPYPMLAAFDAPDANVTCVRRSRSNTPLQALTLLNDPVFFECAQALGRWIALQPGRSAGDKLAQGFERCVARRPAPAELARLERLYRDLREALATQPESALKLTGTAESAPEALDTAAFIAVARTLLNLDELVTRE